MKEIAKKFTVSEVARILGVSRPSVYKLLRNGLLSYVRVLSRYVIREEDIAEYIARNEHKAEELQPQKKEAKPKKIYKHMT